MKQFRKNKEGLFICEECKNVFKSKRSLVLHIRHSHNSEYKKYYDKWLKEETEGKCKICSKLTKFSGFKYYYDNCCSKICKDIYRGQRIEEENLKNFGVKNSYQREDVKEKIKNICLEKHGVEYPQQCKEIYDKTQKNACWSKKYKTTNLNYRGSYELDFLKKYYNKFLDLQNGLFIRYTFKNKNKIYFPDFYIPSLNLIIEIKNSFNAKKDKKKIKAKRKATISSGFNYIMIVDKNYIEFESIILM